MACTDQCLPGTTQCQGAGVLGCQDVNGDGCLEWGGWVACSGNQVCVDGTCKPAGQNDECQQPGQRRCNGSGYQVCGDLDDNGQLEWGQVLDCQPGLTCENGDCVDLPPEETCTNDDFEPNDASDKATPINPGEIRGLMICAGDQDWFSVGLGAGDSLDATLVFDPAAGQLELSLLNSNGGRLAVGVLSADTLRLQAQVGEAGVYYLVIAGRGDGSSAYRLRVVTREAEVEECRDDDFEDNDSIQAATEVIAGLGTGLTICGNDEDWYAIELQAGDTLRVEINFPHRNGDLDLWLYGVQSNLIGSSSSQSDSEVLQAVAAQAGFYKIQVKGNGVVENHYSLQLEVTPDQTCPTDDFEPNDSWQEATAINPGQHQNLTLCEGDQDWYGIHLNEGDTMTAELLFAHRDGNLDVMVFDPFSNQVAFADSTNDSEYLNVSADTTGRYIIQVFSPERGESSYSLNIAVEGEDVCTSDRFESNNNFLTAYPLEVYAGVQNQFPGLQLCENDKDWFKIYMYAGETLIIDLRFIHARGDLDLYLLSDWLELLDWSTSYSDNERIHVQVPYEGIYYIRVSGDGSPNSYDLSIGIY